MLSSCHKLRSGTLPVPGKKLIEPIDRMARCHAIDHVSEIGFGIETVELCCLEYRVEDRGALPACLGAKEAAWKKGPA
jgi:hypothetical protein